METQQVIGILVILGAYGLTWFFLLRSLWIVRVIDREGLDHAGEIKARLKGKPPATAKTHGRDVEDHPGERNESDSGKE